MCVVDAMVVTPQRPEIQSDGWVCGQRGDSYSQHLDVGCTPKYRGAFVEVPVLHGVYNGCIFFLLVE
jgi:hypothetical protein